MQIVGQRTVLNHINELISEDKLPHFIILTGPVGSGKKTIAKYIADSLGVELVLYGNKVDDIRSLIDLCYSQTDNIVYCISDGQDMSVIAKNSMLKVVEEPPKNAYIIFTTTGENTLATIKSRGIEIILQSYSYPELKQVLVDKAQPDMIDIILQCATTPGECIEMTQLNLKEIIELVDVFVTNIDRASIGNALKITSKLAIKEGQSGVNLKYFTKFLAAKYFELCKATDSKTLFEKYLKIYNYIRNSISDLNKNYNKGSIIDNLILNIKNA